MRVEYFAKRHDIPVEQARKIVLGIDHKPAEFVENHFHARVDDPARYNMTLNTEHFAPAQAADAIILAREVMKRRSQHGRVFTLARIASVAVEADGSDGPLPCRSVA